MGNIENYYHILGVSYDATFNEIKESFRKKVKEVHPDKEKGNAEQFYRVKQAYEVLKDGEKRKRYDYLLFKDFNDMTQNGKKEKPPNTNPTVTVIKMKNDNRKRISLSSLAIHATIMLIGILGNRYLKK